MIEIAGLVVSTAALVIQGLDSQRDQGGQKTIRGVLAFHHALADWVESSEGTNFALGYWIDEIEAATGTERDEVVASAPDALSFSAQSQRRKLAHMHGGDYDAKDMRWLLSIHAPETERPLMAAVDSREVFLGRLVESAQETYAAEGIPGLKQLLVQARETTEALNAAREALGAFIKEHIPLDQMTARPSRRRGWFGRR